MAGMMAEISKLTEAIKQQVNQQTLSTNTNTNTLFMRKSSLYFMFSLLILKKLKIKYIRMSDHIIDIPKHI
jgi:hypothetical protein